MNKFKLSFTCFKHKYVLLADSTKRENAQVAIYRVYLFLLVRKHIFPFSEMQQAAMYVKHLEHRKS
mgnify:CR=1 FL=1|tara:strand:+ start:306 stop:503 length:198 start_codon:yes stop_codon:yes gene_type:complete